MDSGLLSMAQQFSGLPMKSLIGGPLQAAAEAQQSLAMTQTNYILETGFSRITDKNGKLVGYKPITAAIELAGTRPVVGTDGKVTPANSALTLDFPILTMMPIPSMAVTSVDITFDMEVKSSYTHETTDDSSSKLHVDSTWDAKAGWGCFSVEVKGSVAYDSSNSHSDTQSYQKSNDARYHVEVKAEQQPLPDGIKMLLQAFSKNMDMAMTPITVGG
ncbi:hypothetical protein AWB61_19245 [Chromobacterium sp. F49]|nr:hypothetical protein Cv017_18690 [Chromobacterium subtsugae]KZE85550.1 hypothetical protein AWB61_19245 [Chromobacterium sp. F49]